MPARWPFPPTGPIREEQEIDRTGSHPTVPGDLDKDTRLLRHGLPSPGNGQPGKPRYKSLAPRHHGINGDGMGRPSQPGVVYEGSEEGGYSPSPLSD